MAEEHEYIDFRHNITDVFDVAMRQGTIVSIDGDTRTAKVNIDDHGEEDSVPIFYHCEKQSVVLNGWSAFNPGDRVLVMAYRHRANIGVKTFEVVGFVKVIKPCRVMVAIFGALAYYATPGGSLMSTVYTQMWNLKDDVPITKWRTKTFPERILLYGDTVSGDTYLRWEYEEIQYPYDPRFPQNNAYDRGLAMRRSNWTSFEVAYHSISNIKTKPPEELVYTTSDYQQELSDNFDTFFSWGYAPMSGVYVVQEMPYDWNSPAAGGFNKIIAGSRIFGEPQVVNMDPNDGYDDPPYKVYYSEGMSAMLEGLIALATPYRAFPMDPNHYELCQIMAPVLGAVELIDIQPEEPEP